MSVLGSKAAHGFALGRPAGGTRGTATRRRRVKRESPVGLMAAGLSRVCALLTGSHRLCSRCARLSEVVAPPGNGLSPLTMSPEGALLMGL